MNRKKIILLCAILLLVMGGAFRYYQLNSKYEKMKVETYQKGEMVSYKEFEITYLDKSYETDEEGKKIITVSFKIKNLDKVEHTNCWEFNIEGLGVSTAVDQNLFIKKNQVNTIQVKLAAGEEKIIKVPFSISSFMLKESDWNNFEDYQMYVILTLYPTKTRFDLLT